MLFIICTEVQATAQVHWCAVLLSKEYAACFVITLYAFLKQVEARFRINLHGAGAHQLVDVNPGFALFLWDRKVVLGGALVEAAPDFPH